MKNNNDEVVELLRRTANAIENNRVSFVNYDINHSFARYESAETEIKIEINGSNIMDILDHE